MEGLLAGFLLIMIGLSIVMMGWIILQHTKGKSHMKILGTLVIIITSLRTFTLGFEVITEELLGGRVSEDILWALDCTLSLALVLALMYVIVLNPKFR